MGITCFIRGHDLQVAEYSCARESMPPLSACVDFDGNVRISQAPIIGFMHYGLISRCVRCDKVIDAEGSGLPILEPDFNNAET